MVPFGKPVALHEVTLCYISTGLNVWPPTRSVVPQWGCNAKKWATAQPNIWLVCATIKVAHVFDIYFQHIR